MKFKSKIICLVFYLLSIQFLNGQDIHFSQFSESPLLINPATAGAIRHPIRLVVNYKNQWKSVINPYQTIAIAFDSKLYLNRKKKGVYVGYGVSLFNDKSGLAKITTNQANVDLAAHVPLNRHHQITLGIKTGFYEKHLNPAGLKWDNQYDGKAYNSALSSGEGFALTSIGKFDLGSGLLYTLDQHESGIIFQGGFAMAHLTKPKNAFLLSKNSLQYKYTGHLNLQYHPSGSSYVLMPAVLYSRQGAHQEIIAGSKIKLLLGDQTREKVLLNTFTLISSAVQFGVFYRLKDAVIFSTAIEYRKNLTIGVSYDVNVSKFTAASKFRGGLEFSLVCTGFDFSGTKGSKNDR
ncbi:MAG: PorP/SprF family type IX secretion system membrane protein [Sphingobacteriaceae bacterium]|nr:PorP/SprF family type IX secretion system membrane protein [Sphingobacteriaceae bacterium]